MVTSRQRKEIQKRMRRIKDAKDSGADKDTIDSRTQELYQYMFDEGLIPRQ